MLDQLVLTPAALLDVLIQIDELKDKDIDIVESDGVIYLNIGQSKYLISDEFASQIEVDSSLVNTLDDINIDAYSDLSENNEIDLEVHTAIQSGIIREGIKTLLIGGLVRLTSKLLK